ncbi:FxSxx-COOH system tetratricopeptide repeat protein [Dactylosporangium sp. NPDC051541]|uniref:FxSxx-COOH system tetratricopeptide repeat protein n=1 Tax=Dactylosporangium sp. NPDC051541 TaxID=3363977 RepID=UPI0037943AAD
MTKRDGQVITFYSYKGGTGRTMALANVAWILAANGYKVLVADWDLEAPGLPRFFRPFLDENMVRTTGGAADLIGEYAWAALDEATRLDQGHEARPDDWYREYAQVGLYAFSLQWSSFPAEGSIDLMLAGRHNLDYATTVAALPWDQFFAVGGGQFLDALREDMKANYDYVLIDSRTGLSDVADICTLHLPDVLVDCFTLSDQGIEGAATIARRVADYEQPEQPDQATRRTRRVLPVPMRVDDGEMEKADAGRALARRTFPGLPAGMTEAERRTYWLTVEVPYRKFFAFEETLATFGEEQGATYTLLSAYETLTSYITGGRVTSLPPMPDTLRRRTLARFDRKAATAERETVIRYAAEDQAWAEWVQAVLGSAGIPVVDPADEGGTSTAERQVLLVSQTSEPPAVEDGPAVMVVYLDSRRLPNVAPENWTSVHGLSAEDAARRVLSLFGLQGDAAAAGRLARLPSEAPQAFNAPNRNPRFTGRAPLLRRLRDELKAAAARGVPVALHGPSGIGKTQVAVEYVHRFRGAYDVVWWVSAHPPQFVDVRFSGLGEVLGLPAQPNIPDRVRSVLQRLARVDERPLRWLLVFDSVEQYQHIRGYLPRGDGQVLITTIRGGDFGDVASLVPVERFDLAESVDHLVSRVGLARIAPADAEQVARAVQNMPIHVALAGAWIADSTAPPAEYLAELTNAVGAGDDVYSVSLERLREESPGAFRLLQVASVLAPDISLDLLYGAPVARIIARHDPKLAAQLADLVSERNIAISLVQRLNRLALIKFDQQANLVQVHTLVQVALRARMTPELERGVRAEAHELLVASRPPGDVEDLLHRLQVLWPHVDQSAAFESEDSDVRQLVVDRIRYIYLLGGFQQGLDLALAADETWSAQLLALAEDDPRHRQLLLQLLHLRYHRSNLLRSLGRFDDSLQLTEETLAQQEALIGAGHPHTRLTAGALGGDLRAVGRYQEALARDQITYEISVREVGADDRMSLGMANNLGTSYRLTGDSRRALAVDEATHASWLAVSGPDHARTLRSSNNLARDLRELGEYGESVTRLRAVVAGYFFLFGNDSREALLAQANLAASLRGAGEIGEAADLLDEAVAGVKDRFGAEHPDTGLIRLARAVTLQMRGLPAEALAEELAVEAIFLASFHENHPYVPVVRADQAVAMWDNAVALRRDGNVAAADELREAADKLSAQSAARLEEVLGAEHPLTIAASNNLAVFGIQLGRPGAREVLEEVVRRLADTLGESHPDTLRSRGNLALAKESPGGGTIGAERARLIDQLGSRVGQHHPSVTALKDGRYIRRILDPHPY